MRPPTRSLAGCVLLSGVLGSIHAYSLFIESFESDLGVGRGGAGAPYSVALASLTLAVLVSHRLFRLVPGPLVVLIASGGAAIGLLLAASANSLAGVVLGYGIVFGAFNGLGYAFSLQRASESNPDRRGFALGLVTAAYALGGASTALVLDKHVAASGATSALRWLALAIAVTGIVTSALLANNDSPARGSSARLSSANLRTLAPLWMAYLLAVLAGLMALGHAAAIVDDAGGPGGAAVVAAGLASACRRPDGDRSSAAPTSTRIGHCARRRCHGFSWCRPDGRRSRDCFHLRSVNSHLPARCRPEIRSGRLLPGLRPCIHRLGHRWFGRSRRRRPPIRSDRLLPDTHVPGRRSGHRFSCRRQTAVRRQGVGRLVDRHQFGDDDQSHNGDIDYAHHFERLLHVVPAQVARRDLVIQVL